MAIHPIRALDHVLDEYRDYLRTNSRQTQISEPRIERELDSPGFLAQEPFFQAHRPFKSGKAWHDLPLDSAVSGGSLNWMPCTPWFSTFQTSLQPFSKRAKTAMGTSSSGASMMLPTCGSASLPWFQLAGRLQVGNAEAFLQDDFSLGGHIAEHAIAKAARLARERDNAEFAQVVPTRNRFHGVLH